jgi:polysaccharide pyruvyl transferase WcaK-like protein
MDEKKRKEPSKKVDPKKRAAKKKASPRKKANPKKKQAPNSESEDIAFNSTSIPPLSAPTEAQMKTIAQFFSQLDPQLAKNQRDIDRMSNMMREYMPCFLLIGYTFDGKSVQIHCAPSQRDTDSLNSAVQRYVFDSYGGFGKG